ncbi:carnosine N-methyltransferase-like [Halichondria panicea]|uniref:carnosine N-methyltransferase-like n=1 Tax=Halichondria panicea TaxID=6063 RepID=UPI00312B3B32
MDMATSSLSRESLSGGNEGSEELRQEQEHFHKVVNTFLHYRVHLNARLHRVEENYSSLPPTHQAMLSQVPQHLSNLRAAALVNQRFVEAVVKSSVGMFENSPLSKSDPQTTPHCSPPPVLFEISKVLTTVKQFYRDWSSEGAAERDQCYRPLIEEVLRYFPLNKCDPSEVSILVPGCGLGRLAYELAKRGYACQGNEFSMFMLLGSNFILNQSSGVGAHVIHPWIHQFSNCWSCDDQLTSVRVPDVDPCDLPKLGLFSMAAGDFLMVYTNPDEWDAVVCCFFIDTAHNVIEYLERIYHILKPGGLWINFGPLLYHYADTPGERSIELSWADLRKVATQHIGFEIINEETKKPSTYIQNSHSMMQMTYNCAFLVARKPYEDGQQTNDTTHRDSEQHLQTNESVPNIYHVESSVDRK